MRSIMFKKAFSLILLANTFNAFAQGSPCENKYWIEKPILETSKDESGIGGTGFVLPDESVLSHTQQNQGEEGIGGTGIVGIIAGFGSICVNGMEVHYDNMTPIFEDGFTSSKNRLALGQTVSILAMPNSQDYYAKEIHVLHEVQGKIESINLDSGIFNVLGQTVHLTNSLLSKLEVGETVAISGNRLADGSIEALRVEPALLANQVNLIGTLETDKENNFYINKQLLKFSENQTVNVGNEVSVQGILQNGVLHVEQFKLNPRWNFSEKVEQVFVQGYVRQSHATEINIDGIRITADKKTNEMPKIGDHASVWIKKNEKQLILEHGNFSPQSLDKIPEHSEKSEEIRHESHNLKEAFSPAPQMMPIPEMNHQRPEAREFNFEKDFPLRPEIQHTDIDKPTLLHLQFNKPEIEKPSVVRPNVEKPEQPTRPEIEHPSIDKPEIEKPNVIRPNVEKPEQPTRPEIEHPSIDKPEIEKPNVTRPNVEKTEHPLINKPEINRPELPNRK